MDLIAYGSYSRDRQHEAQAGGFGHEIPAEFAGSSDSESKIKHLVCITVFVLEFKRGGDTRVASWDLKQLLLLLLDVDSFVSSRACDREDASLFRSRTGHERLGGALDVLARGKSGENKTSAFGSVTPSGQNAESTWNFDVGLPSVVVASRVELHVASEGVGVDGEAVGDDLPPRSHGKTRLRLVVFPKKGEGNP